MATPVLRWHTASSTRLSQPINHELTEITLAIVKHIAPNSAVVALVLCLFQISVLAHLPGTHPFPAAGSTALMLILGLTGLGVVAMRLRKLQSLPQSPSLTARPALMALPVAAPSRGPIDIRAPQFSGKIKRHVAHDDLTQEWIVAQQVLKGGALQNEQDA